MFLLFPFIFILVVIITEIGVDGLWLRLAPGFGEHRVVLGLVGVLEQGLPGVLLPHGAQGDPLLDVLLVRLAPREGGRRRHVGPPGVPGLAGRREADGGVPRRERAALDGFTARARVDDGVAGDALRHVGGEAGVVVDVATFGRLGHDHDGSLVGDLGVEEDVRLGVGASRDDLVELVVPQDTDQRRTRRDGRDEFGFERGGVQDVEISSLGTGDDRRGIGCEHDVGGRVLAGRGCVSRGIDGLLEFPRVPQFDGLVAAPGHDESPVGADVDAARPGVARVSLADLSARSVVGAFAPPHRQRAVQGRGDEEAVFTLDLTAPGHGRHSTSARRSRQLRLVHNHVPLLVAHVDVPDPDGAVGAGGDEEVGQKRVPSAAGDLADVAPGHVHVAQVHVAFDKLCDCFAVSRQDLGLCRRRNDEDLTGRVWVEFRGVDRVRL